MDGYRRVYGGIYRDVNVYRLAFRSKAAAQTWAAGRRNRAGYDNNEMMNDRRSAEGSTGFLHWLFISLILFEPNRW
jgi:hypothetical protein